MKSRRVVKRSVVLEWEKGTFPMYGSGNGMGIMRSIPALYEWKVIVLRDAEFIAMVIV